MIADLAAQVVCTGFTGTSEVDAPLDKMARLGIRATILFPRNLEHPEQIRRLTSALQEALGDAAPALIGVDQEGGAVARLHDGVVALPSMMALGATNDTNLAQRAARRLGNDLRALGINLDFAPVFDLALEPRNTVIGTRSFGSDANRVSEFGRAFAQGLRDGGVIAVGKHFPGHGATETDSHVALPVVEVDAATLRARDVVPFADAIHARIPAIMTAHAVVPSLDPDSPATMSRAILHDLLREELHFEGARLQRLRRDGGARRSRCGARAARARGRRRLHLDFASARFGRSVDRCDRPSGRERFAFTRAPGRSGSADAHVARFDRCEPAA